MRTTWSESGTTVVVGPPRGRSGLRALIVPLALVALWLPGCSILPRRVVTRYVSTYCLTAEQFQQLKAAEPGKIHSQLDGNAEHDSKILAGSNVRLRAWGDGLLEVLGGCAEPDPHALADKLLDADK